MTKYLTIKELKKLLHVGNDKAYALVQMRGFPAIRISEGGQWLIPEDKLEAWLEKIQKLPDKGASLLK